LYRYSQWAAMGLPQLTYGEIQCLMYLKISLSDYFSVFNSRTKGWLWTRAPSVILVGAFVLATVGLDKLHYIQLFHSFESAWFQPLNVNVISWFQAFAALSHATCTTTPRGPARGFRFIGPLATA
jgi:hypothetical protein